METNSSTNSRLGHFGSALQFHHKTSWGPCLNFINKNHRKAFIFQTGKIRSVWLSKPVAFPWLPSSFLLWFVPCELERQTWPSVCWCLVGFPVYAEGEQCPDEAESSRSVSPMTGLQKRNILMVWIIHCFRDGIGTGKKTRMDTLWK